MGTFFTVFWIIAENKVCGEQQIWNLYVLLFVITIFKLKYNHKRKCFYYATNKLP